MNYLKSAIIQVGAEEFTLCEFTALDRIRDLEFAVKSPDLSAEPTTHTEELERVIKMEAWVLEQSIHSVALSLSKNCDKSLEAIQSMLKDEWPQRKLNQAYEMLKALNQGEAPEMEQAEPKSEKEAVSLGKSSSRRGILRSIFRLN